MSEKKQQRNGSPPGWEREAAQEFVYGLSHDMGAPLRSVVQFSQLLEKRLDGRLDEKERYWLQLIFENGQRAQAMVDALLRYSRLNTRLGAANRFELRPLVEAAFDKVKRCQSLPCRCEITTALPDVTGNADHWDLFFTCVIENALLFQPKSPPPGEPAHTPLVRIHSDTRHEKTRIIIDDNGIGVAETHWAALSRPFMRVNSQEEYPGIGMGLSYCERIAQLHGGHLSFGQSPMGGLSVIYSYER